MVKVNLIGFKEFEKKIAKAPEEIQRKGDRIIKFAGERFRELAIKSLASGILTKTVGGAGLSGSIHLVNPGMLKIEVVVGKKYGPFVEWGTITKVRVPSELASYAIQFKGKGLRKNGGMIPRPYFFKHVPQVRKETIEEFEILLKDVI